MFVARAIKDSCCQFYLSILHSLAPFPPWSRPSPLPQLPLIWAQFLSFGCWSGGSTFSSPRSADSTFHRDPQPFSPGSKGASPVLQHMQVFGSPCQIGGRSTGYGLNYHHGLHRSIHWGNLAPGNSEVSDSAMEYKADCLVYPMEDILTLKTDMGLLGFAFSGEGYVFCKESVFFKII